MNFCNVKSLCLILGFMLFASVAGFAQPISRWDIVNQEGLKEILEKLKDKGVNSDILAINDGDACTENYKRFGDNPADPCQLRAFVCSDVKLPGINCTYISEDNERNDKNISWTVTGYWGYCGKELAFEIVDIVPQLLDGESISCFSDLHRNTKYWADLISKMQVHMLEQFVNKAGEVSGYKIDTSNSIYQVEFYAKSCWKNLYEEMLAPDEVREPKIYGGDELDFDAHPYPKVNANTNNKEDYTQAGKGMFRVYLLPCKGSACCSKRYEMQWEYDKHKGKQFISKIRLDKATGPNGPSEINPCYQPTEKHSGACRTMCDEVMIEDKDLGAVSPKLNSTILPNPNPGQFTIKLNGESNGVFNFEMTDVNGNVVFHKNINKSSTECSVELSIDNVNTGNYYYRILDNNNSLSAGAISIKK